MFNLACTLVEASYDFMMTLLIHTNSDTSDLYWQLILENNILFLLLDHLIKIFDNLYQAWVIGQDKLGFIYMK